MAHTHAPAPSTSVNPAAHQRRLIATLTVTGSVFLIEVVSAVLTGSLALLVDAGHMLTDMSVLAASTITAILMRRKPSNTRTWGWARLEVLTAAAGAVVLLVVGIYALMEAGMRLFGGSKAEIDDIGLLLFVGILGLAANIISIFILASQREDNMNMKAAFLEVMNDALGSVAWWPLPGNDLHRMEWLRRRGRCRHRTDDDSARHQVAAQRGQGAAGGNTGWT